MGRDRVATITAVSCYFILIVAESQGSQFERECVGLKGNPRTETGGKFYRI